MVGPTQQICKPAGETNLFERELREKVPGRSIAPGRVRERAKKLAEKFFELAEFRRRQVREGRGHGLEGLGLPQRPVCG